MHHLFCVKVGKLHREGFESVTFRHIVLDALGELFLTESGPSDALLLIVDHGCGKEISQLTVPACSQMLISHPQAGDLFLEDLLYHLLILPHIVHGRRHQIASALGGREQADVGLSHPLPHVLILKVPVRVHHPVIRLNVGKEVFVVEDTAHRPIESMDPRIISFHFLASEALPELDFDFVLVGRNPSEHPRVAPFPIGANHHESIQTEA
mmetsp:Transcript_16687/g.15988  ORF Transcript_16687/g.15988 Transcript_16687/m.15988 type:complete len:210 (+) Transcript_16687:179-808(+)